MGLFFVVVCAVGILRPIKNALALEGLGATEFYRVYLVSAAVVLFVPLHTWLARRIGHERLIPAVALFFAANLLAFRAALPQGGPLLGMLFYGWYDLFAAVLVTQFFSVAQGLFHARNAKRAFPLLVAGGSIGAALGGAVTGFLAEQIGTDNLLLIAAGLISAFGLALPLLWRGSAPRGGRPAGVRSREPLPALDLGRLLAEPHVRLIALSVLLAVLVKQLVDFQFNVLTLERFETREAVSAFQGKFNAATQWLPLVAFAAIGPILRLWGVGAAVLLLPASMLLAALGLAAFGSLAAAVAAKAVDGTLRYSADRTGREILYLPVPEEIKLTAKSYIDIAVEKGVGKVLAAGLIYLLLPWVGLRGLALVCAALALAWLAVALGLRGEYVRALARSLEGRFASLQGLFASLADASTLPVVQRALAGGDVLQTAFALELVEQTGAGDARPLAGSLHRLLDSPSEEVRIRALAVLAKFPESIDPERVRACLSDAAPAVRQAAVRVLCLARPAERDDLVRELLASPEAAIRTAALSCLALGEISLDGARLVDEPYLQRRRAEEDPASPAWRMELALAAGALRPDEERAARLLAPLLDDPDPQVASAALRSAGFVGAQACFPKMIAGLRSPATRASARDALIRQGPRAVEPLAACLLDEAGDPVVRRSIPSVLARIPTQQTVEVLLRSLIAPETDQLLDFRSLKALNKLRARGPGLSFDPDRVLELVEREVDSARRYTEAAGALCRLGEGGAPLSLLRLALREAWEERREATLRCLGLLFPPEGMHRCHLALASGSAAQRASALEWLEETVGRPRFVRLEPVLQAGGDRRGAGGDPRETLRSLWSDGDSWIAQCALAAGAELRLDGSESSLRRLRASPNPAHARLGERLLARLYAPAGDHAGTRGEDPMDLIEKAFLLQRIDLLQGARSSHLALLASIAEEVEVSSGVTLIRQGEPTDALYVVIRGGVELRGMGERLRASAGTSFGTWSVVDPGASLLEARTVEPTRLLRITREEFLDLLADNPELAVGMMQGLARRVRVLAS
jgi:AAA family ATP:ADP antiporter